MCYILLENRLINSYTEATQKVFTCFAAFRAMLAPPTNTLYATTMLSPSDATEADVQAGADAVQKAEGGSVVDAADGADVGDETCVSGEADEAEAAGEA